MESNANQYITSLIMTGSFVTAESDMFSIRTRICRSILSLYSEIAMTRNVISNSSDMKHSVHVAFIIRADLADRITLCV